MVIFNICANKNDLFNSWLIRFWGADIWIKGVTRFNFLLSKNVNKFDIKKFNFSQIFTKALEKIVFSPKQIELDKQKQVELESKKRFEMGIHAPKVEVKSKKNVEKSSIQRFCDKFLVPINKFKSFNIDKQKMIQNRLKQVTEKNFLDFSSINFLNNFKLLDFYRIFGYYLYLSLKKNFEENSDFNSKKSIFYQLKMLFVNFWDIILLKFNSKKAIKTLSNFNLKNSLELIVKKIIFSTNNNNKFVMLVLNYILKSNYNVNFNQKSLEINNQVFQSIIQKAIVKHFLNEFLTELFKLNNVKLPKLLQKIWKFINLNFSDEVFLNQNGLWIHLVHLSQKFIFIFVEIKLIRRKKDLEAVGSPDHFVWKSIIWVLRLEASGLSLFGLKNLSIPSITSFSPYSQKKVNNKSQLLIKQPKNGSVNANVSTETIKSLNRLQEVPFCTNENYLILLESVDSNLKMTNNALWPLKVQIQIKKDYLDELENIFKGFSWKFLFFNYWCKKPDFKNNTQLLVSILKITQLEFKFYEYLNVQKKEYSEMLFKRQQYLNAICLAKYLKSFPLYFKWWLDYRTRMYTYESQFLGLSVVSYLRPLISFKQFFIQDCDSFFILLLIFYKNDPIILEKLKLFNKKLILNNLSNKIKIAFLIKFFYLNKIKIKLSNIILRNLKLAIIDLVKSKSFSTNFHISIDQKSSSLSLLAFIFKDYRLLMRTNFVKKNPIDLYEWMASFLLKWVKLKKNSVSKGLYFLIKLFKLDRVYLKTATMNFFYSQNWKGRLLNWKKKILESLNISVLNKDLYMELKWFSINFPNFLQYLFPELFYNIKILRKIFFIAAKSSNCVSLTTLDNTDIKYKFYNVNKRKIKVWSSLKKRWVSVSINQLNNDVTSQVYSRYKRSFIANFIHLLDGSVLRHILNKIDTRFPLTTLHDCFKLNPVHLKFVYTELEAFYKKELNQNWLFHSVLKPLLRNINNQSDKKKIENLYRKLILPKKKLSLRYFNIKNLYPVE